MIVIKKDMEMPKECHECPFQIQFKNGYEDEWYMRRCVIENRIIEYPKPEWCPLYVTGEKVNGMVPDREKVIRGLAVCTDSSTPVEDCQKCPYQGKEYCTDAIMQDALTILKEQEPVEPHAERDCDDGVWYYGCGACHGAIDYKDKFCRHCGREVKWDA